MFKFPSVKNCMAWTAATAAYSITRTIVRCKIVIVSTNIYEYSVNLLSSQRLIISSGEYSFARREYTLEREHRTIHIPYFEQSRVKGRHVDVKS